MESDTASSSKTSIVHSIIEKFRGDKKGRKLSDITRADNLEPAQEEMITGILKLSELNAREIMIPRVYAIAASHTIKLKELVELVSEEGHSRIPIFDETIDNIKGVLYVKDLLKFVISKPKKFDLSKLLHKPLFIPETMPLDELLVEFKKKRQHLAIVVDEYGGVAGIVTMEDILEQIVGEINDEFDEKELPEFIKINKNNYNVDARISIEELNKELALELPEEEFDTIAGLVLDLFGKIPEKGETISYKDITFKIKDIDGTRINRITVLLSSRKKIS